MKEDLFLKAEKHFKKKQWDKAADFYNKHINSTKKLTDEKTVVNFAKSLRLSGKSVQSEEILIKYHEIYPTCEKILIELNNVFDTQGNWDLSLKTVNNLINLNQNNPDYYFMKGRSFSFLNMLNEAKESYIIGLQKKHGMDLKQIVNTITKSIPNFGSEFMSEYVFINGRNNFGAFIHSDGNKKYFTKISSYGNRRGPRREVRFYSELTKDFPVLQTITPKFITTKILDGILYLTMEMSDDSWKEVDQKHIIKIIETSNLISTVHYKGLIKKYPNPKFQFGLRIRPISIVIFFTKIHKSYYNNRLFTLLHKLMENNNYPSIAFETIEKLQSLILDNKLYAFIDPNKHYSLIHGDFFPKT